MDQFGEASGQRILTARHISVEKSLQAQTNAVNTTLLCNTYSSQPHFESYFEGKLVANPYSISKFLNKNKCIFCRGDFSEITDLIRLDLKAA